MTVFKPDALAMVAGNLPDVPNAVLEGDETGENGNGLRAAVISFL